MTAIERAAAARAAAAAARIARADDAARATGADAVARRFGASAAVYVRDSLTGAAIRVYRAGDADDLGLPGLRADAYAPCDPRVTRDACPRCQAEQADDERLYAETALYYARMGDGADDSADDSADAPADECFCGAPLHGYAGPCGDCRARA
jgi:hypothetical protein